MSYPLWRIVANAYPDMPVLDPAQWPYTPEQLEELIYEYRQQIRQLADQRIKYTQRRYWVNIQGQPVRLRTMRPLLHKGTKP